MAVEANIASTTMQTARETNAMAAAYQVTVER